MNVNRWQTPSMFALAATLSLALCSGCAAGPGQASAAQPTPAEQIANPASVACVQKGGKLEIVKQDNGEVGICTLPDGSKCEEWALFRGECVPGGSTANMVNPASANCVAKGGALEIVKGPYGEAGMCTFSDGSTCEEWSLFRGECKPGQSNVPGGALANPASKACVNNGGKIEIVKDAAGESGVCVFPNGARCDEWAYFRGDCVPGQSLAPARLALTSGAVSVADAIAANEIKAYIVKANQGQTMKVEVTSPTKAARLSIEGADDGLALVRAASDATSWSGTLPKTQDYLIKVVGGAERGEFALAISVK